MINHVLLSCLVLGICSSVVFGISGGAILPFYFSYLSSWNLQDIFPLLVFIITCLTFSSFLLGIKNHLEEGSVNQMYIHYDLLKIMLPLCFSGLKFGIFSNIFIIKQVSFSYEMLFCVILFLTIISSTLIIKRYKIFSFQENFLEGGLQTMLNKENSEKENNDISFSISFMPTKNSTHQLTDNTDNDNKMFMFHKKHSKNSFYGSVQNFNQSNIDNRNLNKKKSRQQEILYEMEKNSLLHLQIITKSENAPLQIDNIGSFGVFIITNFLFACLMKLGLYLENPIL